MPAKAQSLVVHEKKEMEDDGKLLKDFLFMWIFIDKFFLNCTLMSK